MSPRSRQSGPPAPLPNGAGAADGALASIAVGARGGPGSAFAPGELADDDLAVFLEMSNEVFGVFDLEKGLVWSNGTAAALLGYGDEELARLSLVDLIHPDDLVEALALFDQPAGGTGRDRVALLVQGRQLALVGVDRTQVIGIRVRLRRRP